MDTVGWVAAAIIAVSLIGMIATLVPRIREHRTEQHRLKEIDEFHRTRERQTANEREHRPREHQGQGAPHTPQ